MNEETRRKAERIKDYLVERNCSDVVVVDLAACSWCDAFVIATVTSVGHLKGVARQLWGLLSELDLKVSNRHKAPGSDGWELIDCGDIVVHLMSPELREFYSLEKLWKAMERDQSSNS